MCVGSGDAERPALVFLGGFSGLSASFLVPFASVFVLGLPLSPFALALGAGADELLDAPVSACGSWTAFIGNDVGGNAACCFGLALALLTGRCESSVYVLFFPFPVILRCASR